MQNLRCDFSVRFKFENPKLMRYRREFVTSAPLSCHAGSRGSMRMRTNVVYVRVMQRLYRREWNWLWNWLCVNQHPWQRTRGHDVWRLTSIAHWNGFDFTWPLRKQAAYKQTTREPTALSPFEGLGNEDKVPCPRALLLPTDSNRDLTIESSWSYPLSHNSSSR